MEFIGLFKTNCIYKSHIVTDVTSETSVADYVYMYDKKTLLLKLSNNGINLLVKLIILGQ